MCNLDTYIILRSFRYIFSFLLLFWLEIELAARHGEVSIEKEKSRGICVPYSR